MPLIHLLFSFLYSTQAWSYPEFIGYKYSSCLTCHFNGNGNGPLNDYGRALWSAEIAGRALWAAGETEDQLSAGSGFLGAKELPWWIRPAIKSRFLAIRDNPKKGSVRTVIMQADASVALFLDKDQKNTFVFEYGYVPQPRSVKTTPGAKKLKEWSSREHYYRRQMSDAWWLYLGFLDKPFGIRIVDHSAYSRKYTGLAQNDQAHGIVSQYVKEKFEWSVMGFAGNLFQAADLRQKGGSTIFEYELKQAMRVGFSYLNSSNQYVTNERIAIHERLGLGEGSSILLEGGLITDTPKAGGRTQGYYMYAQLMQRFARGYHFFVSGQGYQDELKSGHDNIINGGLGLLMFPVARTEIRLQLDSNRKVNDSAEVNEEGWTAMAQLHVSL